MTLQLSRTEFVDAAGGTTMGLSSFFSLSATGNPAYLVVSALDRCEYTAAASGVTGSFSGNGKTLALGSIGGDGRGAGIVFTWNAAAKTYVNATYGTLNQLGFTDSTSAYDITNLSFFGTNNLSIAQNYASNAYALAETDASGYLGSVTFSTNPAAAGVAPNGLGAGNATPDAIAAAAEAMVGKAWNEDGCWVLASTIAAAAGTGLPVQSTLIGVPGQSNGAWYVAYDGPVSSNGNWQSLVTTGDVVTFMTASGGGHITTCVSGSGSTAQLVDNITYVNGSGQILNPANDGSGSDIIIQAPHPASQEFAGVSARMAVVYALDTPAVHDLVASRTVSDGTKITLSSLFSATDPESKAITSYQVYLTAGSDTLLLGSAATQSSCAMPVTATSLGSLSFLAGIAAGSDQIEMRACNGNSWGDWQSLTVTDTGIPGSMQHLAASAHVPGGAETHFATSATDLMLLHVL